jgi:hypothetical protein
MSDADAAWAQMDNEARRFEEEQGFWADPGLLIWPLHTRARAMKTSQMIQSKFLKKEDFPQPEILTIKDVSLEEVGKGDTRWVLWFKEKAKGIVLNVTKIKQLEAAYGDDSDMWNGRKVKVMHDPTVMMGTQQVGGIKFVFPQGASAPPPPPPPARDEFGDADVPF